MNRKVGILLVATLLLVVGAGPVAAAGPRAVRTSDLSGSPYFTMVGFVTAVGENSIGVQVLQGNRFSQSLVGGSVEVGLTSATKFRTWTPDGCEPLDPPQVDTGDTVSVRGYVVDGDFQATRVTVDVPLVCCTS